MNLASRRWGREVDLEPDENIGGLIPDGTLWQGGYFAVPWEFETRARGRLGKWKRWAELGRKFVVCTFTPGARREITKELDEAGAQGVVYDLQTLCQTPDPDMLEW